MNTPSRHDRRRELRGRISMPISLAVGQGEVPWATETLNLSEGGALVRTNARLAPGTPAHVSFSFGGATHGDRLYHAVGEVVRSFGENIVAVAFDQVSKDLRLFAQTLVGRA